MTGPRPAVRARRLTLMRGERIAVDASDFVVPAGAVTAVVGPNGSGKSTLLHALAGVVEPSSGELQVLGGRPRSTRGRTSYVLQAHIVPVGLPLTVREAVAMGRYPRLGWWRRPRAVDRERVEAAMRTLAIDDLASRHLDELSGGQRQRVVVAQGLAQDHDLLLLDEPTAGVDVPSTRVIDSVVRQEREHGCAVVVATHDLDVARAADHVLLLAGRVLAHGTPSQVLTRRHLDIAFGLVGRPER